MRGREAGHHRGLLCAVPPAGKRHAGAPSVVTTIADDFPITREELDAIEAFLLPQLSRLLKDETPPNADDSETTQSRAGMAVSRQHWGAPP
jgi:hypothetical protein